MTMIKSVYSKQCRYCSSKDKPVQIFWNDIKKYFSDGPHSDSPRHACASSSTKDRQLEQDQKINEMVNDLKSEISAKLSKMDERLDSLQRGQIHNSSLLQEVRLKINEALRETP